MLYPPGMGGRFTTTWYMPSSTQTSVGGVKQGLLMRDGRMVEPGSGIGILSIKFAEASNIKIYAGLSS